MNRSLAAAAGSVVVVATLGACGLSSSANVPSSAAVNAAGGSGFYLVFGRDTLVEEHYSRSSTRLDGEYYDRVRHARVRYVASLADDGSVQRLETTTSRPGVPDSVRVVSPSGDSVSVDESSRIRWEAASRGAQFVLGPSGALMEQLLLRARRMTSQRAVTPGAWDTITVRILEAGSRGVRPLMIRWFGQDSATATAGDGSVTRFATPSGRLLTVHYPTPAGMRLVRAGSAQFR